MTGYWHIIPTLVIDREKYRGKGRPRKTDYRIYPDLKRDLKLVPGDILMDPMKTFIITDGI